MKRPHTGKRNLILKSEIDYTRREHVEGILTDESSLTKCANWNPSPSVASLIQAISNSSFSHLMPELFAHNLNKLNRNFVVSSERLRWGKKSICTLIHNAFPPFSSVVAVLVSWLWKPEETGRTTLLKPYLLKYVFMRGIAWHRPFMKLLNSLKNIFLVMGTLQ